MCLFNFEVSINLFLQVIKVLLNSSCALPSINLVLSASLRSLSIPPSRWLMKLLNSIGPNTDSQGQSQHNGHQLVLELDCHSLNKTAQVFTQTAYNDASEALPKAKINDKITLFSSMDPVISSQKE